MTTRSLAFVGIRLLGIYLVVRELSTVSILVTAMPGFPDKTQRIYSFTYILPILAIFIYGLCLVALAPRLASRFVRDEPGGSEPKSVSSQEIQSLAFSIAGVIIVCLAAPEVVHNAAMIVLTRSQALPGEMNAPLQQQLSVKLISHGFQAILGLCLFLRARGLAWFWHRIQTAGVYRDPERSVESDAGEPR